MLQTFNEKFSGLINHNVPRVSMHGESDEVRQPESVLNQDVPVPTDGFITHHCTGQGERSQA